MMKKRLIACLLALAMTAQTFAGVPLNAKAAAERERYSVSVQDSDLALNGIYDIYNLEIGSSRTMYVNTYPEENTDVQVLSYDADKVRIENAENGGFRITALAEGTAEVVLEGSYEDQKIQKEFFVQVIQREEAGTKRFVKNINVQNWKFSLDKNLSSQPASGAAAVSDAAWEEVTIPHCWNSEDGADGGNDYYKGIGWYETKAVFDAETYAGKEIYLEFEGASKVSELYVNGNKVGRHEGGYSIFRFDISDFVELDRENTITLSVDNRVNNLMPLSGDFTVFGGLYRDVSIIAVAPVHLDLNDYGSSGVQVTQHGAKDVTAATTVEDVFGDGGKISVASRISNESENKTTVTTKTVVYDAGWNPVAEKTEETAVAAEKTAVITQELTVENPHLWDGVDDPYLYNVVVELYDGEQLLDRRCERLGFRFYCVDREKGFYLNGRSYPLRGVNSHQDRAGKGYAAAKEDRDQDMAMISEIGANTIRFAHYQHDQYVYGLADEMGITVWAEIPLVNGMVDSDAFRNSTKNNLRELVNQSYNHASIVVWGLHNEQWPNNGGRINTLLRDLYDIAYEEDPSRLVTVATAQSQSAALSWQSDVSAWNKYFGLYESQDVRYFGTWLDQVKDYADTHETISVTDESTGETIVVPVSGKIGMSEYGVGCNIEYHEENPGYRVGTGFDAYQSEEFQSQWHEIYYEAIDARDWVWGTYVWNMFEFGSDSRSEAGRKGINNKGMVSYDREVKKDVFYFYQANWSDEPMVHINSKRFAERFQEEIRVKVYANVDDVELFVNGVSQGVISKKDTELNRFNWDVKLGKGDNKVVAVGHRDGKTYVDEVTWKRALHKTPDVTSALYNFNNANPENRTVSGVADKTSVAAFKKNVTLNDGTMLRFYDEDGTTELTDDAALLKNGMHIHAVSEDLSTVYDYVIVSEPVSRKKTVIVQDEKAGEPKENLVDGDTKTAYNSGIELVNKTPQQVIIDLGAVYQIYDTNMLWWDHATSHRTFTYNVKISNDQENWTTLKENVQSPSQAEGAKWSNNNFDQLYAARYVMIEGLKATNSYATMYLYEAVVNGFALQSDLYGINNQTCIIKGLRENTTAEQLLSELHMMGNYDEVTVVDDRGQTVDGAVDSTMYVKVTADGKEVLYKLAESGSSDTAISRNKKVTALDAVDKDGVTKPNEDVLEGETDASHGNNYAPAAYINDGKINTRWSGAMNAAHNTAIFPAVVVMDLGDEYHLNHVMMQMYAGSTPHNPAAAPNRYYNYRIYASNEEEVLRQTPISEEYLIVDGSDNITAKKTLIEQGLKEKGRYIAVEIMNNSTGISYHAPSVWELEVEGYRFDGNYEVDEENRVILNVEKSFTAAEFIKALGLSGNYHAAVVFNGEAYDGGDIVGEGCALQITSLDGSVTEEYAIRLKDSSAVPLSQNKKATALATDVAVDGKIVANEDAAKGFVAANINDGDTETRWSGVMNQARTQSYYPASVNIELTNPADTDDWYYLTGVDLTWFNTATNRSYQYELHSINPVGIAGGWDMDATDNRQADHTEHWVQGKGAQIKDMTIKVSSSSLGRQDIPAVVKELKVYGWRLRSDAVDEASETVLLPKEAMNVSQVLALVNPQGNCKAEIVGRDDKELALADTVTAGCKVIVTDVKDQTFTYQIKDSSSEEPEKDEYTVKVDGTAAAAGKYNTKVTVTADAEKDGKKFAGWKLKDVIVCTDTSYTFYISGDMELTASYEAAEAEPCALMTNTISEKNESGKTDVRFVGQLVVPEGSRIVNAGLVWSSKEGTDLVLGGEDKETYISRISNTNQFSVTIKGMPAGRFIRGKIFATLVDAEGKETCVYSEERRADAK